MTLEQQQLLAKAESSLQAAKLLLEGEFYDAVVSRTYYAMFYVAEAFLLTQELSFTKHTAVISKFGERFAKTGLVPGNFIDISSKLKQHAQKQITMLQQL